MIHLRPLPNATDESLSAIKADMTDRLRREIVEDRLAAHRPRHFKDRQHFLQHGEKA